MRSYHRQHSLHDIYWMIWIDMKYIKYCVRSDYITILQSSLRFKYFDLCLGKAEMNGVSLFLEVSSLLSHWAVGMRQEDKIIFRPTFICFLTICPISGSSVNILPMILFMFVKSSQTAQNCLYTSFSPHNFFSNSSVLLMPISAVLKHFSS